MFEIIRDKEPWERIVEKCDYADFYHTYSYHKLSKKEGEDSILICYTENETIIALPLLLRHIEGTLFKDATSVYGYPGPIYRALSKDFDYTLFSEALFHFFKEQKIVSVFSRLNPFITFQENCLSKMGKIETLGKVVYIDLTLGLDEQWALYSKRLRTYINKSRTIYELKKGNLLEDLDEFIELYHENMDRVKAKEEYYFDRNYFLSFINSKDFETKLLLALDPNTGEVAGGAIFTLKNDLIQYHLSGAREKYLDLNPVKLILDEMRIRGASKNYKYLNLGGGIGSKEDSLFYFKSGFSKKTMPFKVWKYKVDENIYENLVLEKVSTLKSSDTIEYFPLYRMK